MYESEGSASNSKKRRISTTDDNDVFCVASDAALAAAVANAQELAARASVRSCVDSDAALAAIASERKADTVGDVFCVASDAALAEAVANAQELAARALMRSCVDSDAVLAAVAAEREAEEAGVVAKAFECPCCFEHILPMNGVYMSPLNNERCGHMMCSVCFERFASGQIEKKELCRCPLCPAAKAHVIPGWLIQRHLGATAAAANSQNEQIHLNQVDGGRIRLWQCPTPDCTNRHLVPEGWDPKNIADSERVADCTGCGKQICLRCDVEEHAGFSCEQFKEWRAANASAETSYAKMLKTGLIKPCPNCAAPILKNDGCNFIICAKCKCKDGICWETGKPRWGPNSCGGGHQCH